VHDYRNMNMLKHAAPSHTFTGVPRASSTYFYCVLANANVEARGTGHGVLYGWINT